MTAVELCVGVTTAPRTTDYFHSSLASLLDSVAGSELWVPQIDVYAEPNSPALVSSARTPAARVRWHQHRQRFGNWHNWRFAAADLLQRYSAASTFLLVEDDVQYAHDAVKLAHYWTAACAERAQFGYLSLYTSGTHSRRVRRVQEHLSVDGISAVDERITRFWGACAMAFTRDSLQALLDESVRWLGLAHERDKSHIPASVADIDGRDIAIHQAVERLNRRSWFLRPSAVQHVGEVSIVAPGAPLSLSRRAADTLPMDPT